jgi:transposase
MAKANGSKSSSIRDALKATPDKSGGDIAKELGVSTALVYKVKARMSRKKSRASGKKAAVAKKSAAETSKAQMIRDVAKELGKKVRPRDVVAKLAEKGVKVSSPQVSVTLRAAGYRRKRRGMKAAVAVSHPASGNGLNVEALVAAKALIAKVGSVETAEEAIKVLKKLG